MESNTQEMMAYCHDAKYINRISGDQLIPGENYSVIYTPNCKAFSIINNTNAKITLSDSGISLPAGASIDFIEIENGCYSSPINISFDPSYTTGIVNVVKLGGNYNKQLGGSGGGGAVTIANGADIAQGSLGDPAATDNTSSWSLISMIKGLWGQLASLITNSIAGNSYLSTIATNTGTTATELGNVSTSANQTTANNTLNTIATSVSNLPAENNSFSHYAANGTYTVKSGAGVLAFVNINTLGTGTSLAIIYNGSVGAGNIIASINTTTGTFALSRTFNVAFNTLILVTSGTTSPDVTISYN